MFSVLRSVPEKRIGSMNAVCVYVSTAQLVLQSDHNDTNALGEQRLGDMCRLFSQLRQLLSCAVCARLLNDPFAPLNNARCQHNVCRLCVRGRKCLRPLCLNCKDLQDFKTYTENRQMRCLLLCYKSLCEHLLGTSFFAQLSAQKAATANANDNFVSGSQATNVTTCGDIIQEGARYEDILSAFNSDLPHAPLVKSQQPLITIPIVAASNHATPLSASAATPLAPLSVTQLRANSQTAAKAATPPVSSTTSVSSSSAQTIPATAKAEQTSNRTSQTNLQLTPKHNQTLPVSLPPHTVYVKHIKPVNETTSTMSQLPSTQTHTGNTITCLSTASTITYMGSNTPGIVVPIVSSSATTTAPLTIASSKLQSLKRQLTQARNQLGLPAGIAVKAATLSKDTHAPLTFKVSTAPPATSTSISAANSATIVAPTCAISGTPTTATITSQQIRNPPSIKTVSNGSAMYSVLYTGIGNKITIKRKTDGDEDSAQRKNVAASTSTSSAPATSTGGAVSSAQQALANKLNSKRRGCRCGNATPTPGKLTCCGQRCPCYVDSKSCIGCKCRGCRNPHRPDGGKVRPIIPELACYEIHMADDNQSLSPSELPVATTITARTSAAPVTSPRQFIQQQHQPTIVSEQHSTSVTSQQNLTTTTTSKGTTLIPFISFHSLSAQQAQPQQQHQHQQQPQQAQTLSIINSNQQSNVLPLESVLIQNAEGKYQVVNVLTTGSHTQNTAMQRIHGISQLQVATVSNSNNITSNMTAVSIMPTTTSANVTTTTALPQVVLQHHQPQQHTQHQQQHHHQPHQHQHKQVQRINVNSNSTNTIPLQLHHQSHHAHQLKSNIITMRAPSSSTQTQTLPLMSHSSAPTTTITLSPIIGTFNADMFSDSSESDFISLASNNCTNMLPICTTPNTTSRITAVPSLSSGSNGSTSGSASRMSMGMSMNIATGAHITPALAEIIESSDV